MSVDSQSSANRRSPSERVVTLVANRADADPLRLPPLYEAIDPDALDAFVRGVPDGEVRFRYVGYVITVESTGTVHIEGSLVADAGAEVIATERAE